jgi:site-specific recombinase XerD
MASMSLGSFNSFGKNDCRPLKIEIHAGWSEAHGDLNQFVAWLQTRRVDWDIPYRIERIDIVGFINKLAAEKSTAVTRRRKLAAIRGFLKFCKDNQIIFGNPADTIEGPIREQRDPVVLLKTEYKALLQVAGQNRRDFAIVMLFLGVCVATERKTGKLI